MVDKQKILQLFRKYFDPFDYYDDQNQPHIHNDGTVDAQWQVYLEHDVSELPVKFGTVNGDFTASEKSLATLKNMPKIVRGNCNLLGNNLTTLIGAPFEVGGNFEVNRNPLQDLIGFPQKVGGKVTVKWSQSLPLLRTLNAQEVVVYGQPRVSMILNKYAKQGKRAMFHCQKELEDAGFDGNARW
jgi:hypothetical protein